MFGWFRRWRASKREFPAAWRAILERHAPFYRRLDPAARGRFEDKLKIFAATKAFIPAGGMEIDERVVVLVSACAARLAMNLPGEHFARLTEIVVYPSHYKHPGGDDVVIFGEAHHIGTMVLSYDAVTQGLANEADGHNTAMHELAHVLDAADGSFDGTPVLRFAAYAPWARVMSKAFLELRDGGARRRNVLRSYGATNEAEFFAVATEAFFEKPLQLRKKQPQLYELLREYYRSDPAEELSGGAQPASGSSGHR
jgi:Mlc titration factor MtfA (ptsG expression regulator)